MAKERNRLYGLALTVALMLTLSAGMATASEPVPLTAPWTPLPLTAPWTPDPSARSGDGFKVPDLTVTAQPTAIVAEPGTLAFFGLALAGLGYMVRRRRAGRRG